MWEVKIVVIVKFVVIVKWVVVEERLGLRIGVELLRSDGDWSIVGEYKWRINWWFFVLEVFDFVWVNFVCGFVMDGRVWSFFDSFGRGYDCSNGCGVEVCVKSWCFVVCFDYVDFLLY